MSNSDVTVLKQAAKVAEDDFEERLPYLLWNEANATSVVGSRTTSNVDYHLALDSWEKDARNILRLSTLAAEAEINLAKAVHKGARLERTMRKIAEYKKARDEKFNQDLKRIQTLREFRPRT